MRAQKSRPTRRNAAPPACEHAALIASLREQIASLEYQRDEARHGLSLLEFALRRQGCCDGAHENRDS